jgi:predicted nuclease with RNAse H fold
MEKESDGLWIRSSVSSFPVYVGIDVACAIGKRLPICVVSPGCPLMPLTIPKHLAGAIPRGVGNKEITAVAPFREAARGVVSTISQILDEMGWHVERTAVDAPAAPPAMGSRASENELGRLGLSSFRTPSASAWAGIRDTCAGHLGSGGSAATLPHANKIWMLFGFELFASLKSSLKAEVIEVYPFAIVRALLPACQHKTTEQGYRDQLNAVAARTGWEPLKLETRLKATVSGSRHDRLDAFMAAWVASLPPERRRAFGDAQRPDDAIWVPL